MTIIAVSDVRDILDALSDFIYEADPDADILEFEDPLLALAQAREEEIDIAFLDTETKELGGITLGTYLKELNPSVNLIFVSRDKKLAFDAIDMHASGYLLKPPAEEGVRRELDALRYPEYHKEHKRVFAQTFGNFEFYVDGKPVDFKYKRTKEILAILINNSGAQTTNGELIACLWEDDGDPQKKLSYLGNLRQDLQNTFTRLKLDGILHKQRGSMAIAKDKIECDLYEYLEQRSRSRYPYTGEYMKQYSWAEYYHAELDELSYED